MIPQNHARSLLEKVLDHPDGLEILRRVSELAPNVQSQKPHTIDDLNPEKLELIAKAQLVVKSRGIVNPPDFRRLSNDQIYAFIAEFGQAQ
ncbi:MULTISPECIES: hypothetical protein [unclassified Microcoleus]|uniref:hypothetical protein n=1 Tax=unclassified Microcoleus TaxID=2642155 RepID=UPI0025FF7E84|nr:MULTISPECIES: hypothetical protein [unclassified Microcoleus]